MSDQPVQPLNTDVLTVMLQLRLAIQQITALDAAIAQAQAVKQEQQQYIVNLMAVLARQHTTLEA